MKDSLKEDNPNSHFVIKYSNLNGEIGMTSDVDKMNDKDDIVGMCKIEGTQWNRYLMLWINNVWLMFYSLILMNNGSW